MKKERKKGRIKAWFKRRFAKFKREWQEVGKCLEKNRSADSFLALCFDLTLVLGIAIGAVLAYLQCNYQLVPIA